MKLSDLLLQEPDIDVAYFVMCWKRRWTNNAKYRKIWYELHRVNIDALFEAKMNYIPHTRYRATIVKAMNLPGDCR